MVKLMRQVFTAQELAELFGVSVKTIYRNSRQGQLPTIKLGRRIFFPKKAVFEWLKTARLPQITQQTKAQMVEKRKEDQLLPLPIKSNLK